MAPIDTIVANTIGPISPIGIGIRDNSANGVHCLALLTVVMVQLIPISLIKSSKVMIGKFPILNAIQY